VNDTGNSTPWGNAGEDHIDIPFEDVPERGSEPAKAADSADSAQATSADSAEDETSTESPKERTSPGPGSTGPTTVREDLGTLAEEARRLWSSFEARVVAPAIQSYPEVARHLGTAGREVAAALRSAIRSSEQTWRDSDSGGTGGGEGSGGERHQKITVERVDRIDPPEQKNRDL